MDERFWLHAKLNFFIVLLTAFLGVLYLALLANLPDADGALPIVAGAISITTFICLFPLIALYVRRLPDGVAGHGLNFLSVLALGFLVVLSYGPGGIGFLIPLLALSGVVAVGACFLKSSLRPRLAVIAMGTIVIVGLGVLLLAAVVVRVAPPFSFAEAMASRLFIDTLWHIAITQMIAHFGIPSLGIDGVVPGQYHFGSHYLIARLSILMNADVPGAYPAYSHLVVLPLLLRFLAGCASDYSRTQSRPVVYIVLLVAVLAVIYAGLTNDLYFQNLSYPTSLVVMLGIFPLFLWFISERQEQRRVGETALVFGATILLLPVMTFIKVSTGFMVLLGFVYGLARSTGGLFPRLIVIALAAAAYYMAHSQAAAVIEFGSHTEISPFTYYFYQEIKIWHRPLFFLIYPMFSLAFIFLRALEEGALSFPGLRAALSERRLLDAEVLFLITVLGFGPGMLLDSGGDAVWYYFYDFQAWLGIPLVAGRLLRRRDPAIENRPVFTPAMILIPILMVAPLLHTTGEYLLKRGGKLIGEIIELHAALEGQRQDPRNQIAARAENVFRGITDPRGVLAMLAREKSFPDATMAALRLVRSAKQDFAGRLAIYIPQTNREYWRIPMGSDDACMRGSLFVPALTGVPLVDGMPPLACGVMIRYLFGFFPQRTSDDPLDDEALCVKTRDRGFDAVYRLSSLSDPTENRLLRCR